MTDHNTFLSVELAMNRSARSCVYENSAQTTSSYEMQTSQTFVNFLTF